MNKNKSALSKELRISLEDFTSGLLLKFFIKQRSLTLASPISCIKLSFDVLVVKVG